MLKYSDGAMLLISRAISPFIPPFYSTSKNFYGIILAMLTFSSLFMAQIFLGFTRKHQFHVQYVLHSLYFKYRYFLNPIKFIQYCRKTSVKLKSKIIP